MLVENKYKIRFKSGDPINLNINLTMGPIDFVDFKEDNDVELEDQQNGVVNEMEDGEVIRFKPLTSTYKQTTMQFLYGGSPSYLNAGFTIDDISESKDIFKNSSYLIQVYDSPKSENQALIHSNYINGYQILTTSASTHTVSLTSESFNTYVNETFLNQQSGDTFNLYFKFFFYSAKEGKVREFTQNVFSLTNESQSYISIPFNRLTRKYTFPFSVILKELPQSEYLDIINETIESISLQKPTFPTGNTFNINGEYSLIE